MLEQSPRVSVIIPNWNGAHLLQTCLDSLKAQTYRDFETIVVDNASTDDSLALLARDYPWVRVLPLSENRGFAGGVNAGIRAVKSSILVLLNDDTEADGHWLEQLVRALDENPEAGMAACKLRLFVEREKLHSAGDFYRVDGVPGNRGVWELDRGQWDDPATPPPVFGACGGAAAYRRELFERIGLFDEELYFNCEDVDLNWRARLAGFDCTFAPHSIVYHMLSATGGGVRSSYYSGRNFILVLAKNYPAGLWKKHWRHILTSQMRITWEALRAWRGEAARARLRGQIAGLLALPRFFRKRNAVQSLRCVTDQQLDAVLAK